MLDKMNQSRFLMAIEDFIKRNIPLVAENSAPNNTTTLRHNGKPKIGR